MRRFLISTLAILGVSFLMVGPQAFAITQISVQVSPAYCDLAPLGGVSSCSGTGSMNSDSSAAQECLYWSFDGSYLSVSVTILKVGNPTSTLSSGPLTTDHDCPGDAQDYGFDFTVSYVASTCVVGTYPVNFTATKGTYYNSTIFDAYVKCVSSPQ